MRVGPGADDDAKLAGCFDRRNPARRRTALADRRVAVEVHRVLHRPADAQGFSCGSAFRTTRR